MVNNNSNWYSSADWYEPLHRDSAPKPQAAKKKRNWTKVRFGGILALVLLLIIASSLIFSGSDGSSSVVFWTDGDGNGGSWSNGGSDSQGLPDNKEDFFNSFYTQTDTSSAVISIPCAELPSYFEMQLEKAGGTELGLNELFNQCSTSIVGIFGYVDGQSGYYWGTGIVMSEDGLIVTNTHLIDGCDTAKVELFDGSEYEAQLVGADTISDIAVLKIDAEGLDAASFADNSDIAVGDKVAAIGNPLGEAFRLTMTDGIISAIERGVSYKGRSMTLLQTNTAINEGNSGGALFNMYGQVIGITNMKMMSSYSSIEGIGFAIPTSTVRDVVNSLIADGEVRGRPSIGITVGAIDDTAREKYGLPEGLYVSDVQEKSDAAKQGIKVGDIITEVNFQPVTTTQEVNDIKNSLLIGDIMIFQIWRDGETFEVEVVLMDTNDIY